MELVVALHALCKLLFENRKTTIFLTLSGLIAIVALKL